MTQYFRWEFREEGAGDPLPVFIGQTVGFVEVAAGNFSVDELRASPWTLESRYGSCTLTHLSIYCGTAAGDARLGVYTDSAGEPSTLVAETGSFALASGWNKVAVPGTPTLTPARYWLVFTLSSGSATFGVRGGTENSLGSRYVNRTFQAMPASFPGGTSSNTDNNCVYATLESQTDTKPADPAAPSVPSPIAGQGYSLVFQDEFDWYNREQWSNQVFWGEPCPPNCQYTDSSILHVVSRVGDLGEYNYWPNITMDTCGAPGLDAYQHGYFEARMRSTGNRADFPAWWLFSTDWAKGNNCTNGDRSAELDCVELWGSQFPTIFSGTAHSQSDERCGANNQQGGWQDLDPIVTVGQWHTYALKWTPTLLTWYVDNTQTHTVDITTGYATLPRDMHLVLYQWPDRGFTIDGKWTYWLSDTNSGLTGGADFNKVLAGVIAARSTLAVTVAAGATEVSYGFTASGQPGATGTPEANDIEFLVDVDAGNANMALSIQAHRISSAGAVLASSSTTAEQTLTNAGVYTFNLSGVALGTWAATNRYRVDYRFRNTAGTSQSVTLGLNTPASANIVPLGGFWYLPTLGNDPDEIHAEFDWVRVWQQ